MVRGEGTLDLDVTLRRGEAHGVGLWRLLGAAPRKCGNACSFCFVDQLPPGLRAGVYEKDDDYRLSFLAGNFTTLAGLDEGDLSRIERLRLSPLYVSLHAWDDDVRVRLMGPAARVSRARLLRLAAAGIEFHLQIVLCPGVNDGAVLTETLEQSGRVRAVCDVGVVPVSLAREGELRRVTPAEAGRAIDTVEALRPRFREALGRDFAHPADELYLLAKRLPPAGDAAAQYENGVGIVAAFLDEAGGIRLPAGARVALLSGRLAAPVVTRACERLNDGATGAGGARAYAVDNRLFGPHVTVTGLLGGQDVLRALGEQPLADGEWLLAPRDFLPAHLERTLDDVSEGELRAACGGRLALGADLRAAVTQVAAA